MKRLLLSAALALSLVACSVSTPQETPTPPPATSVVAAQPEAYVTEPAYVPPPPVAAPRVEIAKDKKVPTVYRPSKPTTPPPPPPKKQERKVSPPLKKPAKVQAPAPAKKPVADQDALIRDCKADAFRLCPWETAQAIAGNRGPITACMLKNKAQLSPACKAHG